MRRKTKPKVKWRDKAVITVGERAFIYISFALLWLDKLGS